MIRCLFVVLLWGTLFVGGTPAVQAQGLDEQYVRIYNLIQAADSKGTAGQFTDALAQYLEAQTALRRVQQLNPDWNARLVSYRLEYIADKISGLSARAPVAPVAPTVKPGTTNATLIEAPAATPAPGPEQPDPQIAELRDQVSRLQGDKMILEAKLKEALAAQPAAVDPRDLAKAEERVQALNKENALLKASLATEQAKPAVNPKQLDATRAELVEANRKLAGQIQVSKTLSADTARLQTQLQSVTSAAEAADALRTENELLKKQVVVLKSAKPTRRTADVERQLSETEARYAALQSDVEILKLEKLALQGRVRSMTNAITRAPAPRAEDQDRIQRLESERTDLERKLAAAPTKVTGTTNRPEDAVRIQQLEKESADLRSQLAARPTTPAVVTSRPDDAARIKQLELERDQLRKDLGAANQKLASREGRAASRKIEQLTSEIETLRARVQVFEARVVPYGEEELALFKAPAKSPAPRDPNVGKVSSRELPAGGAGLSAEAQRHFANRDFAKAEASYQQILRLDEKNAYTLANLAAIQMEQGKLDEADKNLRAALAASPQDTYCLSLFGIASFRREKFDEALDALSKAAKLDPKNAEVQNYLGMTLSEKGLRGPAETALRKAIELEPNNGGAHNNLAVIYLTQNPPLAELARWHYQKALAAKHPRNLDLEKMLDEKGKAK